jgi:pimeloyl-ACP methyl ester carboxylesterase
MRPTPLRLGILAAAFFSAATPAGAQDAGVIRIHEALVIPGSDFYRSAASVDPIEARIVTGEWSPPHEGDVVPFPDGGRSWRRVEADSAGWIADDDLEDGYAYATIDLDADRVMILEGYGYQLAYVNGEPRAGNLYGMKDEWAPWEPRSDFSRMPVRLSAGRNHLLLVRSRVGAVKARVFPPPAEVFLNARDVTIPDLVAGQELDAPGAVVVVNATTGWARHLRLVATAGSGGETSTAVPDLPPLSLRKVGFEIRLGVPPAASDVTLTLRLAADHGGAALDEETLTLGVKAPSENRRRTFVSDIDGSVQHFAVNPAQAGGRSEPPGLVLTVHGAGVEALNQSASYHPKRWCHIVAPTNRRPFGFNWEDWGRLDALEVLDIAMRTLDVDPGRVYLTGHSMGGHGTWHIGALYPDRFAALGPSAGWISFWSYRPTRAVEPRNDVERMIMRATLPSRTLDLVENYEALGVYVLHGADDDNVPVDQARTMAARLREFHPDFVYHEEPDAGHWWDKSGEPGTDCVDWAPMFDFFARHARPGSDCVRHVRFLTPNPGVSASCHWMRIDAQVHPLEMSAADIRMDPGARRFAGTTANVARIALDASPLDGSGPVTVEIDTDSLALSPTDGWIALSREADRWVGGATADPGAKNPRRYGTFKDAFRNRVVFVYGTAGAPDENAWAYAKARFDAEAFWYQANGSIAVVPDVAFDPGAEPDRNVVLYGNSSTNRAWAALLGESPVQVVRGELRVGEARYRGDDLGILMIRPRPGSDVASVGTVSGTGVAGMRLCDRRPYLSAGFAYPDVTVFRARELEATGDCAILAGFFGLDWSVEAGDFAATDDFGR